IDSVRDRPIRAMVPSPTSELKSAKPIFVRGNGLEKTLKLAPTLPVMTDVEDVVRFGAVFAQPRFHCLLWGMISMCYCCGIVAEEENRAGIIAQGRERRLQNPAGNRREALDPFPILVSIELDPMIGVVFDRGRFIVYAGAIDDDSSLPRHQIKQMREMWQVGKIRCLVDHKNCDVERLDIAGMWDIWQIIARLAEHRHFV